MTLGHETAAAHAPGVGVDGVLGEARRSGRRSYGRGGAAARCLVGAENYYERPQVAGGGGLGVDGGMADYLLVPHHRHLVPLPPGWTW